MPRLVIALALALSMGAAARILAQEAGSRPPQALPGTCQEPVYPPLLRDAGVEGAVYLNFAIGADGVPYKIEVAHATHAAFVTPARAALLTCRFQIPPGSPSAGVAAFQKFTFTIAPAGAPGRSGGAAPQASQSVMPPPPKGYQRYSTASHSGYESMSRRDDDPYCAKSRPAGSQVGPCHYVHYIARDAITALNGFYYRALELCRPLGFSGIVGAGERLYTKSPRRTRYRYAAHFWCTTDATVSVVWTKDPYSDSFDDPPQSSTAIELGRLLGQAITGSTTADNGRRTADPPPARTPNPTPPSRPVAPAPPPAPTPSDRYPASPDPSSPPPGDEVGLNPAVPNRADGCAKIEREGNSAFVRNRCTSVKILFEWYDEGSCRTGCVGWGMDGLSPGSRETITPVKGRWAIAACEYSNSVVVTSRSANGWPLTYKCS